MTVNQELDLAGRRGIEAAPEPEAKKGEIECRLKAITSPFRSAHAFDIEDIIDHREISLYTFKEVPR